MRNEQLFGMLEQNMVDLRKLPNSDPRWGKIHAKTMPTLAGTFAVPMARWRDLSPRERTAAALYAHTKLAPKAVLLGKVAALIHEIPLLEKPTMWEATVPSNGVPARGGRHRFTYRHTDLRGQQVELHGVRVSSLARTVIDIARYDGFAEGLVAVDAARARGLGKARLDQVLGEMGRVKGVAHARRAIAGSVNNSESPWEFYARALLIAANLPGVKKISTQLQVSNFRADLGVNGWLLIEIDGNIKYEHEPHEVILAEHRRQQAILNQGYVILRFSPQELRSSPQEFVDTVARHLAAGPRLVQR